MPEISCIGPLTRKPTETHLLTFTFSQKKKICFAFWYTGFAPNETNEDGLIADRLSASPTKTEETKTIALSWKPYAFNIHEMVNGRTCRTRLKRMQLKVH